MEGVGGGEEGTSDATKLLAPSFSGKLTACKIEAPPCPKFKSRRSAVL